MKEALLKLINVKSVITVVLSIVFGWLAISGRVSAEQYMNIFTVIIAFYFGTQSEKQKRNII